MQAFKNCFKNVNSLVVLPNACARWESISIADVLFVLDGNKPNANAFMNESARVFGKYSEQ